MTGPVAPIHAPTKRPAPGHPAPRPWRTLLALGLALGVITLLTYSNSFTAGFTLDNQVIVAQDPRIRAWTCENLRLIFTQNYWWPYARRAISTGRSPR